jgi:hypothetical protein
MVALGVRLRGSLGGPENRLENGKHYITGSSGDHLGSAWSSLTSAALPDGLHRRNFSI